MRKPPHSNVHRLARLILCARAMIIWAAAVLFDGLIPSRRRIRQRYGMLSIDRLTRLVRILLVARAGQMIVKRREARSFRDAAGPGFRRRVRPRNVLRSIAGSRLRRFMRHGGDAERFARLVRMLNNLDAYARAFLLRRAENGVNRLAPVLAVRPPHDAARTLFAPSPAPADSS